MRRLHLERTVDATGLSGTGIVAEGVLLSSGKVVLQWLTQYQSINIYGSVSDVLAIHGHGGTTTLVYHDRDEEEV